ncbi:MAG TPA: acyl carrier protein [Nitrospinota bacterium]|jgi:acyl carrier protein|nr:acyl carrier protein [Nitrospinota bacterium]|tara:strand:- start:1456 stop:1686 length:231 start_codon:yes stop_codon:yes gene_type:complete
MNEKIKNIFVSVLDVQKEKIMEETSMDDIPEWDSLAHVSLVSAIEEEFDINMSMDEITSMLSVKNAIEIVSDQLNN